MDSKLIFGIAVLVVILVAVVFNKKVKAGFGKFNISTDNRSRKNTAHMDGSNNELEQGVHKADGDMAEEIWAISKAMAIRLNKDSSYRVSSIEYPETSININPC